MSTYQEFVQQLRQTLRLSDVVRSHVKLQRRGREFVGLCPFHNEKGASFTVNDDKGFYHCFGCGVHGDLFDFVMQKLHMPFKEVVELLADQAGLSLPKITGSSAQSQAQNSYELLYQVNEAACQWFEEQLRVTSCTSVLPYLKQRGLTKSAVLHFRLGYAPEGGLKTYLQNKGFSQDVLIQAGLLIQPEGREPYERFRRRLMFPIQDAKGRVIGFGGRIIDQGEPKYLNSPDTPLFHKGKNLYAMHHALAHARSGEPFIVVEGYMDVIALHQGGIKSALAPLGTALTGEQIQLLWKTCETPILWFDGDEAGRRAAERAALKCLEVLKPGYSLQFAFLPSGEDPDSLIRRQGTLAARQCLSKVIPLMDVLWRIFMHQRVLETPEQKAKARKDLIELTQSILDPDTRHFYRQELNYRLQALLTKDFREKRAPIGPQINPSDRPLLGSTQKKLQGQKILLATVINHPTLIADVAEQLMILEAVNDSIDELRHALLTLQVESPDMSREELVNRLQENGFSEIISEFEQNFGQTHGKFVSPSASYEEALQGWREIWQVVQEQQFLHDEATQAIASMASSFDEGSWQRLKLIKQSLLMRPRN